VNVWTDAEELERLCDRARHNEASALRNRSMEIAKNLKNRGLSAEDIAADTGLTVDDILRL